MPPCHGGGRGFKSRPPLNMIYIFLILLLFFNFYFYFDLVSPPRIKVISPQNKEVFKTNSVVFKGFADKRGELFINEIPIYLNDNSYFENEFFLKEGVNRFIIREKKFWGQEKQLIKEIYFVP